MYGIVGRLAAIMFGESGLIKTLVKKVWQMNRSVKRLAIVADNLDGFSLANC